MSILFWLWRYFCGIAAFAICPSQLFPRFLLIVRRPAVCRLDGSMTSSFDHERWLKLLPHQAEYSAPSPSLPPLAPDRHPAHQNSLFAQGHQPVYQQPSYSYHLARQSDFSNPFSTHAAHPYSESSPLLPFPSPFAHSHPPQQPEYPLHPQNDLSRRQAHAESLRGNAPSDGLAYSGAQVSAPGAWTRPDPVPSRHDSLGFDFGVPTSVAPVVTSTTPRAPTLVLVAEGGPLKIGDEDRAAVTGLLGLGLGPSPGEPATVSSVTGLGAFVDEPLDLDPESDSSDDAEGEDDDEEREEEDEDDEELSKDDDGDYAEESEQRSRRPTTATRSSTTRPLRRARTTSTLSRSHSHTHSSHSSSSHSISTPPTRSPTPDSPGPGGDSPPTTLKRPPPISSASARTTALPNKRRYRTSTTSGSGAFRCLHPSADGGPPCPVSFRRSYDLARHRDSKHGEGAKGAGGWRCRSCGGEFARKDSLQRHAGNKGHEAGV